MDLPQMSRSALPPVDVAVGALVGEATASLLARSHARPLLLALPPLLLAPLLLLLLPLPLPPQPFRPMSLGPARPLALLLAPVRLPLTLPV